MRVVAIDQGTTSTRGFVLEPDGSGRVVHAIEHRQSYPQPGWVEHDPQELIEHIGQCLEAAGGADAIGIDNQGESCLAWDAATGRPVSPLIVWQDNRTQDAITHLKAQGSEALTLERAGLPLDAYFSASKLRWILDNVDEAGRLLKAGRLRLGTSDAFFLDRLAGVFATDITTASRTSLMNLETGEWDADLCDLFGVPIEALPEIRPTMGAFGTIRIAGSEVPVSASAVDQQASLYGHGCRQAGDAKITFGTGAFALALTGNRICRVPERGLLPTVAWQQAGDAPVYALDGGVYCASSAVNWARSLGLFGAFAEIDSFEQPPAITRGLAFVPALTGLACPHWDRSAAGLWIGMSLDTTRRDLVQSVLEGVALRACEVIAEMSGQIAVADEISIDGGMSANPYFCQFLADALGRRVSVQVSGELTARGIALMAAGRSEAADERPGDRRLFEPRRQSPDWMETFSTAVQRCRGWR